MKHQKILVVDDLEENREIISSILKSHQYELIEAGNGREALALVEKESPDIILMDINMPVLDGLQACRKLKENLSTSQIPVIFLTSRRDKEDLVKAFNAGAVDYLTKPFYPLELLARIKTHLELQSLRVSMKALNGSLFGTNTKLLEQNQQLLEMVDQQKALQDFLVRSISHETLNLAKANIVNDQGEIREERIVRTFVYFDIAGFTAFSESSSPLQVASKVNEVFKPLSELVYQFQGDINQFVQDSVFCVFADTMNAVECAISIQRKMRDQLATDFQLRVGIHCGPAIRCNLGSELREEHTYLGSSVNLAGHLEGACPPGKILVSKQVYDLCSELPFQESFPIILRGTDRKVDAFPLEP